MRPAALVGVRQRLQFTQEDPIGLAGGLNLYGFAAGDPINFWDPFGLCRKRWGIFNLFSSKCQTRDEAARRGMQSVHGRSVREDREYGGEIVSAPGGGFQHTKGRGGSEHNVGIRTSTQGYEGAYHTHGADNPGYDDENFSDDGDKKLADDTQKPVYVATPSGRMMRYDPDPNRNRQGRETEIGRIKP